MHCNAAVNRETIVGMFDRLHNAGFIQGSAYARNILTQPGPLTNPCAQRSFDSPSYRLIDFGRGQCYDGDDSQSPDEKIQNEKGRVLQLCEMW